MFDVYQNLDWDGSKLIKFNEVWNFHPSAGNVQTVNMFQKYENYKSKEIL